MAQMLQGASNPQQAIQTLASQNPQISGLLQMANGSGGLKNLFYQRAQQMGVDPETIISQLK